MLSVIAPKAEAAEMPEKPVDLDAIIQADAAKYGVNEDHLYKTLECESDHFKDVAIQSEVPDPTGPNGREDSWGLAQIHLPDHPDISRQQAQDPVFAIEYAAQQFANGGEHHFHCYDIRAGNGWQ